MPNPRGRIIAQLDHSEIATRPELVDLINRNIKPPTEISAADIFIRAMFILSDEINAYGGRFPSDEHDRLAELLIDSPVLVGHRRDLLPIGRTFHAACLARDGRQWIKSYFYWLRSADGAETLRDNIDSGIYKECSIGFIYRLPECSVCGKDIRICQHEPLQRYAVNSDGSICHFNYRQIEKVLETSLVYRGAIPDTSITRDLTIRKSTGLPEPVMLHALADLPSADRYLVAPRYDGLDILLEHTDSGWKASRADQRPIELSIARLDLDASQASRRFARLVGYRGKERCSAKELERSLAGSPSPVSRAVLFIYPQDDSELAQFGSVRSAGGTRIIRSRFATREQLIDRVESLATRDGVEIRPIGENSGADYFVFNPAENSASRRVTLARVEHSTDWLLEIDSDRRRQYLVHQFDPIRFARRARFLADPIIPPLSLPTDPRRKLSLPLRDLAADDNTLLIEAGEDAPVKLRLQSIRLEGKERTLFHQI
ncbi:MAG: hypothetical protein NDJ18_03325 [candidate division Zixibacteria bacterium]|nr:hypothetical protein [candidate division Zixibacteria bacterium]